MPNSPIYHLIKGGIKYDCFLNLLHLITTHTPHLPNLIQWQSGRSAQGKTHQRRGCSEVLPSIVIVCDRSTCKYRSCTSSYVGGLDASPLYSAISMAHPVSCFLAKGEGTSASPQPAPRFALEEESQEVHQL